MAQHCTLTPATLTFPPVHNASSPPQTNKKIRAGMRGEEPIRQEETEGVEEDVPAGLGPVAR